MNLGDLYASTDIKSIRQKTKISEDDLQRLLNEDFSTLSKPKALGFITILAREYSVNLDSLKASAQAYYSHQYEESKPKIAFSPIVEESSRSKWVTVLILIVLGVVTWYFFTQFDKKTLGRLLPTEVKSIVTDDIPIDSEASLKITKPASRKIPKVVKAKILAPKKQDLDTVTAQVSVPSARMTIIPRGKFWFGLIDMDSGLRDQFTISKNLTFDLADKSWLLATDSHAFSLIQGNDKESHSDGRRHYFEVNNSGIKVLTKKDYISQGGYPKW